MERNFRGLLLQSPWCLALLAAIIIPVTLPLMVLILPAAALAGLLLLSFNRSSLEVPTAPQARGEAEDASVSEQPASIAAKASTQSPAKTMPPGGCPSAPTTATRGPVGGAAILARLRTQREAKAAAESRSKRLTVLYASQTGTAAEITKNIHAEAEARGVKSQVASMNEFGFDNLSAEKTPVIVLVASSTGDGDAPDNAAKFYATARRRTQSADLLKGISFTCLGLGDSNYTRFMHVPRALRTRFAEIGATPFYSSIEADEVDGIEEIVDKWVSGLWPAVLAATLAAPAAEAGIAAGAGTADGGLQGVPPLPNCRIQLDWLQGEAAEAIRAQGAAGPSQTDVDARDEGGLYSPECPFWAPVSAAAYLTAGGSDAERQVLHVELDISGSGMAYAPGDSIGVLPHNSAALVDGIMAWLGLDPAAVFAVQPADAEAAPGSSALKQHLRCPCTVRSALLRGCDLTTPPRKSLLRVLAEHCSDEAERRRLLVLCSRDGRQAYTAEVLEAKPTLLDLLCDFPSCRPPLDALLDALPALPPRMYSIACSSLAAPGRVQVAFTVVRYSVPRGEREGVATTWLQRLCAPAAAQNGAGAPRVPIFLRRGGQFRAPADLSAPWVLIGPGTGVAPFRGFLQERRAKRTQQGQQADGPPATTGECWLYFGCRGDQDFLYRRDLQGFVADGTLTRLEVAFSRAQADKVYVQHLMARDAAVLHDLIVKQGGYVFVCGDGAAMAKDVHAELVAILAQQGGVTAAEAGAAMAERAQQGRYVRDIWS